MAYLHCHSCDWSQDDFWTRRYNPITKFWDDVKWLARPRMIRLEGWLIDDLVGYTGVKVRRYGPHNNLVFSWKWLWLEFWKQWRIFRRQRWWTTKAWNRDKKTAVCPKCGNRNFDID